jgi:hypothetical protein
MSYTSPVVIDQDFVDVDFSKIIDSPLNDHFGGYNPTDPDLYRGFQEVELSGMPVYPRSEWAGLIRQRDEAKAWPYRMIVYPHNQGREGTCVYNMAALMYQIIWNMQFGFQKSIQVSPISGYRWNARGPNSGSYVGQAGVWLAGTGLLPTNREEVKRILTPHGIGIYHPNTGWSNSFANNWKQTARFFRIDEWFKVTTVEGWVSALLNGFVCGGGRDSHAICHCGLTLSGSTLYSVYCNSWGNWGSVLETVMGRLQSFGFDSEAKIRVMVGRDAWAVRSIVVPDFMLSV